ncbi:MAG: hypothetical protein WC989_06955 [Micavibrio sp.]
MRHIWVIAVLFALAFGAGAMLPSASRADAGFNDPPLEAGGGGEGESGGTCDFQQLKDSLIQTESSGGDCTYKGTGMSQYGAARGKYQFIEGTWNRMAKGCPNASQCPHAQIAYNTACCVTQECAMDNLLLANKPAIEKTATCQKILGTTISSPKNGSCTVTMSGLLAAWHLGGNDACDGPANGTYGDCDGKVVNGVCSATTEADYICRHGGLPVPDDCQPKFESDPSQMPPIGTLQQIRVREGQNQPIIIGSAGGLKENWVAGLMLMAEQFTTSMISQIQAIGKILDAKHQLETQRLFQEKVAQAHKDYHPSEQMCTFGTFARDLLATSTSADLSKASIAQQILQRELGAGDSMGTVLTSDNLTRISRFRKHFCNPKDNGNGLALMCPEAPPADMMNRDINYTDTIDLPLSLEINLTDGKTTDDEIAVFALVDNLFAHTPLPRLPADERELRRHQHHYMNLRSITALRGIARNSISNILAMKTATPNEAAEGASAAPYMRSLFRDFGLQDDEIRELLGDHPSYYAQMELLAKKIYQSPAFYTNLYDKPANVARVRAAMQAIKLMQERDIQQALQRREMLLSVMLELRLREQAEGVYSAAIRGASSGN